jgi:uncharacterized repeat protein (TIGR01451 family)
MKGSNFLRHTIFAISASVLLLGTANADEALKMELTANKVVKNSEGKITYLPVRTAPSGTVIQYKATYTNTINKNINDLAVILPIPANMTFTGEAIPSTAQGSIDGKNYADMPLMRKVDGKMVKIPLSEYRTLRWDIKLLPANKSAAVALNTIVD